MNGGAGGDTITGGTGKDEIHGGTGNDLLKVVTGDVVAGEIYDGGDNTDTLQVTGTADFRTSTVTSIEALTLGLDGELQLRPAADAGRPCGGAGGDRHGRQSRHRQRDGDPRGADGEPVGVDVRHLGGRPTTATALSSTALR